MMRILLIISALFTSIHNYAQFEVTLSQNAICAGDTITVSSSTGALCDWEFGPTAEPTTATNVNSVQVVFQQNGTFDIIAERVSDAFRDTAILNVHKVRAEFIIDTDVLSTYHISTATDTLEFPIAFPVSFDWDFDDGTTEYDTVQEGPDMQPEDLRSVKDHFYAQDGIYSISLTVTDNIGCTETKTVTDTVDNVFSAPNIVVPQSEVDNLRRFSVTTNGTFEYSLVIYSRWGNIVYESAQPSTSQVWDGRLRSQNYAPSGVYYYIVTADVPGQEPLKGFFHLFNTK